METLFDGDHTTQEIAEALPPVSKELFTEEFLHAVRHPTGVLRGKLHEVDAACDWRPDVPVHIFHARGDADVEFAHARYCRDDLASHAVEARVTDVGDVDHNTTVLKALPQVAQEFSRLGGTGSPG